MTVAYPIKSRYVDALCTIAMGRYIDESIALTLLDAESGQPWATPTVCLIDYHMQPEPGNVFLKAYSESGDLPEALAAAGVVELLRDFPIGPYDAKCWEAKLLIEVRP